MAKPITEVKNLATRWPCATDSGKRPIVYCRTCNTSGAAYYDPRRYKWTCPDLCCGSNFVLFYTDTEPIEQDEDFPITKGRLSERRE